MQRPEPSSPPVVQVQELLNMHLPRKYLVSVSRLVVNQLPNPQPFSHADFMLSHRGHGSAYFSDDWVLDHPEDTTGDMFRDTLRDGIDFSDGRASFR